MSILKYYNISQVKVIIRNFYAGVPILLGVIASILSIISSSWNVYPIIQTFIIIFDFLLPECIIFSLIIIVILYFRLQIISFIVKKDYVCSIFDILLGFITILCIGILIVSIVKLEYSRIKLLKYNIGPGSVLSLIKNNNLKAASNRANHLISLGFWGGQKDFLLRAEHHFKSIAKLNSKFENKYIKISGSVSSLKNLECCLFGKSLNEDNPIYQKNITILKESWNSHLKNISKLNIDKVFKQGYNINTQHFKSEFQTITDLLLEHSKKKDTILPYDKKLINKLIQYNSFLEVMKVLIAYDLIETWFSYTR